MTVVYLKFSFKIEQSVNFQKSNSGLILTVGQNQLYFVLCPGSTPYATMGAREVMRRVKDGYRLDRPAHCRLELFRVITQCWHSEPSKRPTFSELKAELAQLLSDSEHHGSFVDLDSYADQMRRDSLHRRQKHAISNTCDNLIVHQPAYWENYVACF